MNWEDLPIGTLFVWTGEQGAEFYKYLRKIDINKGIFFNTEADHKAVATREHTYEVWNEILNFFPQWERKE